LFLLALAVILEGTKLVRAVLQSKSIRKATSTRNERTEDSVIETQPTQHTWCSPRLKYHIADTVAHVFHLVVAYLLMLAVMSYNTWLFIATVIGSGLGYFVFGIKRDDKSHPLQLRMRCYGEGGSQASDESTQHLSGETIASDTIQDDT